jgi:hypothetical protein
MRSRASRNLGLGSHRYEEYQNDEDNEKMPSAFDLGWRRNLLHLFGPRPQIALVQLAVVLLLVGGFLFSTLSHALTRF